LNQCILTLRRLDLVLRRFRYQLHHEKFRLVHTGLKKSININQYKILNANYVGGIWTLIPQKQILNIPDIFTTLSWFCYWLSPLVDMLFMKRKFKQCWSTIRPISTKQTITSHLNSLNIKRPRLQTLEIRVLSCDRHKDVAGFMQ